MTVSEFRSRLPDEAVVLLQRIEETPRLGWPDASPGLVSGLLQDQLAAEWVASRGTVEVLRESLLLGAITRQFGFLRQLLPGHRSEIEECLSAFEPRALRQVISIMHLAHDVNWTAAEHPDGDAPFPSDTANLIWNLGHFESISYLPPELSRMLARFQAETMLGILGEFPHHMDRFVDDPDIFKLIGLDSGVDSKLAEHALGILRNFPASSYCSSSAGTLRQKAFGQLQRINRLRNLPYRKDILEFAVDPEFSSMNEAVEEFLEHRRAELFKLVTAGLGQFTPWSPGPAHLELFRLAVENLAGEGGLFLNAVLKMRQFRYGMTQEIAEILLADSTTAHLDLIREMYLPHAATLTGKPLWEFWKNLASVDDGIFLSEWASMAVGKSKPLRETAAAWLLAHRADEAQADTETLLASETVEGRLAGIALLASSGAADALTRLTALHAAEPSKQVWATIAAILVKHGVPVTAEAEKKTEEIGDLATFETSLTKRSKSIRLPKALWLDFAALPPLLSTTGSALSPLTVTYVFQNQARGHGGEIVPEVAVLLPHLNRAANAAFAHALLDQWFNSPMKPPDRWALDVAGITGDDSIIPRLTQPIEGWCRQNRGSRAEWAVHAISLLGTETALGVLDGFIHRYRSDRKYVSEAAAAAIRNTAAALGIEDDELAERIVPEFGYDSEGCRDFPSSGETVTAVLKPDFRIVWRRPGSAAESANPPSKLTAEAEAEWKEIRKSLKAAVTRLTSRLENAMISARRWNIKVWRDRFEHHPLFQLAAMRLVWGVYDKEGMLLRTFRLYSNNLTAGADGSLEEFAQPSASVGVVHPLELDSNAIKDWAAHLARFKVGPLFRQVDRPVHRLDSLPGNRQSIQIADQIRIKAGTLRGHFLGKGWTMGSTGDEGWIRCVFRHFPACGLHAYLPVEEFHAASAFDQEVLTGSAFFARAAVGKKATRDYMDRSQALHFRELPPVVYSETVSDLKAIITQKEAEEAS